MTTLRILLRAADALEAPVPWALYDGSGACVATGRAAPQDWPRADSLDVVIAASQVRLASIALPPVPPGKLAAAAAFALEDQLAGPADAPWLAPSSQPRGRVGVGLVTPAV